MSTPGPRAQPRRLAELIGEYVTAFPTVRIRVGDYKFDNTNWTGAGASGPRYDLRSFPLDDDPQVMRQYLWLYTDSVFKGSLQSIARKRAALRNVTVTDQLADFGHAEPFVLLRDYTPAKFDQQAWVERIRRISGAFNAFPSIRNSGAQYTAADSLHRFITNEGTDIRVPETIGEVEIARVRPGFRRHDCARRRSCFTRTISAACIPKRS